MNLETLFRFASVALCNSNMIMELEKNESKSQCTSLHQTVKELLVEKHFLSREASGLFSP